MRKILTFIVVVLAMLACKGGEESSVSSPLQAIDFVQEDGAEVKIDNGVDKSRVTLAFEITPKEYITTLSKSWESAISCAALCDGQTVQLPIESFRSSVEMGKISITASCCNLPESFFAAQTTATAVVTIADDNNTVSSVEIPFTLQKIVNIENIKLQKFPKEDEIKVMSFNVRVETSESKASNNWSNRKEACVALIKDQKPCIIGFQEAKYTSQWIYLREQFKGEYDGWGLNRETGGESGSGEVMGILYNRSKLEKLDGGTFWLSPTPNRCSYGWDAACRRTATWGVFRHKATNTTFLYINTHLDHQGIEARIKGLEQLAAFIAKYPSYPAILGGDMNIESYHEAFKPINAIMNNTRTAAPEGYTDDAGTFNDYAKTSQIIDHIYCSKSMQVVEYHTINEKYGVDYVSDHYPIYAIIKMK